MACKTPKKKPFQNNNQIVLKVLKGKYLSEKTTRKLIANANGTDQTEVFYLLYENDDSFVLKSSSGHFLSYGSDSIIDASIENKKLATKFLLVPHKQYFYLKTEEGLNVVAGEDSRLKVSLKKPQLFEIDNLKTIPRSLSSLAAINWGRFFVQLFLFVLVMLGLLKIFKRKTLVNSLSYMVLFVIGFILVYITFDTKLWNKNKVIRSDAVVYYEYLPAAVVFKDLSFDFIKTSPEDFQGTMWLETHPETGRKFPKTTMGVAFVYLPFFLVGHVLAIGLDYTAYGYSKPYGLMITLGCLFYALLGLFYLRKILLLYFNDKITAITLFLIAFGTNLFYYITVEPGMSHAYSFALVSLFVWNTIKWHTNKTIRSALIVGALAGIITLVRPSNALVALFFMFYQVVSFESLKRKAIMFWKMKMHILIIIGCSIMVWLPQLAFWKYATGNWLFSSYGEERFYFNNPHILDGLFSYRKGWLLYTPIMAFALLGIGFLYKKQKELLAPILIFIIINIYVTYSWWSWFYGGSFSSRPMVDSYVLMAIPLAAFFNYLNKKRYLKVIAGIVIVFTVGLNLFQTQQSKTCLHGAAMTKEAYWTNFTLLGWDYNLDYLLREPDNDRLRKGLKEYETDPVKE